MSSYKREEFPYGDSRIDSEEFAKMLADINHEENLRQVSGAFRGLWFCVRVLVGCGLAGWTGYHIALIFQG